VLPQALAVKHIGAITATQASTAKAIINLFETGEVLGEYGNVTLIAGDTGHLTFGRSQTTLGSGNLALLLQQYCANQGARFAGRLSPFLPRFAARDETLDHDLKLHNVLRASADDPVMRETQDSFFDKTYWQPALSAAGNLGLVSPLATAVVYDSVVHGSWKAMRDRTVQSAGAPDAIGEQAWIGAYVATRRDWLANNARTDLRPTVYRMDAFKRLIDQGFWDLALPLVVRGKEISPKTLVAMPPGCYDGPQPGSRPLTLQTPLARGLDVRLVQLGLSDRHMEILADGIFGQTSVKVIKAWQSQNGRPANGIVDLELLSDLTS
jgi:chitosanase